MLRDGSGGADDAAPGGREGALVPQPSLGDVSVLRHRPDVVLMDVRTPRMDGLAATAAVTALTPAPRVVVLTTFDLDEHVLGALRAGASGFLLEDTPPRELVDAVRVVAAGEAVPPRPSPGG